MATHIRKYVAVINLKHIYIFLDVFIILWILYIITYFETGGHFITVCFSNIRVLHKIIRKSSMKRLSFRNLDAQYAASVTQFCCITQCCCTPRILLPCLKKFNFKNCFLLIGVWILEIWWKLFSPTFKTHPNIHGHMLWFKVQAFRLHCSLWFDFYLDEYRVCIYFVVSFLSFFLFLFLLLCCKSQ